MIPFDGETQFSTFLLTVKRSFQNKKTSLLSLRQKRRFCYGQQFFDLMVFYTGYLFIPDA